MANTVLLPIGALSTMLHKKGEWYVKFDRMKAAIQTPARPEGVPIFALPAAEIQ